jgi:hypothetical protein
LTKKPILTKPKATAKKTKTPMMDKMESKFKKFGVEKKSGVGRN